MSLSDLASLSLSSSPPTASLRLGRSLAQLDLSTWPVAYFEAVQGLDDDVEGLSDGVRRELVLAAGKAAGGASVWDLAVVVRASRPYLRACSTLTALEAAVLHEVERG